jgi:hypothetical protein
MSGVRRLHWDTWPAKAHDAAADVDREDDPAPAYVDTAREKRPAVIRTVRKAPSTLIPASSQ